ncbi:hypothetical protein Ancab_031373 [Ancistrocladus abbreviatus]
MSLECFSIANPNPSSGLPLKRASMASSSSLGSPFLQPHGSIKCLKCQRLSILPPKGLAGIGLIALPMRSLTKRSIGSFAASQEDSNPSELDIPMEKNDFKKQDEESEEAWEQVLASFREQAMKLQSVSQEAYEVYSKKALVVLKETAERLKIEADEARNDLNIITKEIGEEGKQYLATVAENSPESVKDVIETFAYSTDDLNDISKVRDFYIGIPYGALLSLGGFLNFMLNGNISAIRFGVILGGALLALSILSLRLWKKGESPELALKGQAAIASILFLRDLRLLSQGRSFAGLLITILSGAVATFFVYRMINKKQLGKPNPDGEAQL